MTTVQRLQVHDTWALGVQTVQCTPPALDPNDERTIMQHDMYGPAEAAKFLEQLTSSTPLVVLSCTT